MVQGFTSVGIIIISLLSLFFCFQLLKIVSGIIKIPFVSTFFMLNYVVYAYIGSVLLNVFYFQYEINTGVYERPDLLLNIWFYTSAGLFLIPFGMWIANLVTNYKPYHSTNKLLSRHIELKSIDHSYFMFILLALLFGLSIFVLLMYISKVGNLPIIGVLDGLSTADLRMLRSDSGNNFDGKHYRYVLFMKTLPLLLLLILFFLKNISFKWKIFFYIVLSYNIFVNIMDIQKAPVIQLFLVLMLAYFYSKNKINRKILATVGIVLTSIVMLMYIYFMGMTDKSFFDVASAPMHRIFIGQISPFYYWQLFQEQSGYLYGTSFPNPAGIFPFEWRRITVEIMEFGFPELVELGIVGSMPTVFFADWFINFGPIMALFSMILLGFILQIIDIVFISYLSNYKSLLMSALFVFMIRYFAKFAGTGYQGLLIDTNLYFMIFVVFLIIFLRKILYATRKR